MTANKRLLVLLAVLILVGCNRDPKAQRDKYLESGRHYLTAGRYEEAIIQFRNALRIDAGYVPIYLSMANAFQGAGDPQAAVNTLLQTLKIDSKNVEAKLQLCTYLLVEGARTRNPQMFKRIQEMADEILKLEPSNVEARIMLGNAYAGLNEVDESIREMERALALDPGNLKASLGLGAAQYQKKDNETAERTFKETIKKHPDAPAAYVAMGRFYMATLRQEEAEGNFRKAFDLAPADPGSLAALVQYYLFLKRNAEAENVLQEAIKRKPDAAEPRWGLANLYVQEGSVDKGIETIRDILKRNPKDTRAQLRLAELYLDQKDLTKAEEIIRSVLTANKNDAGAHYLLGRLWSDRKDPDKALAEFDIALKLQDSFLPPYLDKANLLLARGDLEGSQNTLNAALQRDRNNMLLRGALAKVLALRQKPDEALQEAQEVLAAMPGNIDAITARAAALQSLGKPDEAKKEYLKLGNLQPGNASHWSSLGLIEAYQGDSVSALLHFRKAVELKPDFITAINNLLALQLKDKKFDEALAELDRLSKGGSPQDEIHRFRGQVYLTKGDAPAAERELRKAIEVNPQNYQAYVLLAQMNAQRNNIPQALKEVDQLIARNDRYVPAYLMKALYLDFSKDLPGAVANYRKVLQLDQENPTASNNLAWLLCESGTNLQEALSLARTARKKVPESPEIADTLGWIYCKLKNYTLAVDQLSFSINNSQKPSAEFYYHLGMAYYGKGDLRMAQQTLKKSLDLNPNLPGAEEARKILKLPS